MATQQRIGTHATTVRRTPAGVLSVVYHDTEVVKVDADGRITLDSGGWRSATTKTRMNQAANQYGLGYLVRARAGSWYVEIHPSSTRRRVITFADRMTFRAGGDQ